MAATPYHDLDEDDGDLPPVFPSLGDPLPPPRPPRRPRPPVRTIALILGLGSLLGIGLYAVTARDPVALLGGDESSDPGPRLTLPLPVAERMSPAGGEGTPAPAAPVTASSQPSSHSPAPKEMVASGPAPERRPAESAVPLQPLTRPASDKPPSFDSLPELKSEGKPLPVAPVRDLLHRSAAGDLPGPAADGREPRQVYARPWAGAADQARVGVVVVDLGLDRLATETAIRRLPPEVTLAFSPYAPGLDQWIRKARDHGHEVLMMVPNDSEAGLPVDPGPYGLAGVAAPEANLGRLEKVLARGPGAAGLLLLGEGADPAMAATVLGTARDRGLLVVGPGGTPPERTPALALVTSVIDRDLFREAIDFRFNQVLLAARQNGQGVAVVHPRPLSFERLAGWLGQLGSNRLVLAPVSALTAPPPAGRS